MKASELANTSFGNAAGTIKKMEDVLAACRSAMTHVTIGSITVEPRVGNSGDVYYYHPTEHWSLNSLGLPNMGLTAYMQILPEMRQRIHAAGKTMCVSVAGFAPEEYANLAYESFASGADEVELNLGCPNVWGKEGQKPIASYHPELTAEILAHVKKRMGGKKVKVKISPVMDLDILTGLAKSIEESDVVYCVVASNTLPNQNKAREDGRPALNFNDGNHVGGLAGAPLFSKSLNVVEALGDLLPYMQVIGVGGIFDADHVLAYLRKGVSGVQCATAYIEQGPRLFSDIFESLSEKLS